MNKNFITFEGGEGAGKTTLARRIRDALQAKGIEVVLTREPGGTPLGEDLRHLLLNRNAKEKIAPKAELFAFLASRIQHVEEVIKPAIARGAVVLCDRFSDSSIAYQGIGQELGLEYVLSCCKLAIGDFEPDLTFFLDVNPDVGFSRVDKRNSGGARDRMEQETAVFHARVHAGFVELAKKFPKRIVRLDGSLDPDALFSSAYDHLQTFLQK